MNAPLALSQSINRREEAIDRSRPLSERRPFGAYYTPRKVADTLANWAIRSVEELVLEPGFGGCGFLEASLGRIEALGALSPLAQIYGCDTDHKAFSILENKIGEGRHDKRFLLGDFLSLNSKDFQVSGFDVIIGNPPYVSLHAMSQEQRSVAAEAMNLDRFELDKRASLWAYFVLHAMTFLRQGGRCAWVLPSSYLYAEYAREVRNRMTERFSRLFEITLEQRLFTSEGAKERTVIVLAEGFESCTGEPFVQRFHVTDAEELEEVVVKLAEGKLAAITQGNLLSPIEEAMSILESVRSKRASRKLGEFLDIKIGIVTGANSFFIKSDTEWKQHDIDVDSLHPILAKFSQVSGLELTAGDLLANKEKELKCLLLDVDEDSPLSKEISRYLGSFPVDKMQKNSTFKKRTCWYRPNDGRIPDGFLSYMCDHGPRLALNPTKTTSTNTIHRVYFRSDIKDTRRKALALSMLSTVTQLSAELVGRSYGSGVLKLEPSEARRVDIILSDSLDADYVPDTFDAVDKLLRGGEERKARQVVDDLFVAPLLGKAQIASMDALLTRLRSIRREPRMSK